MKGGGKTWSCKDDLLVIQSSWPLKSRVHLFPSPVFPFWWFSWPFWRFACYLFGWSFDTFFESLGVLGSLELIPIFSWSQLQSSWFQDPKLFKSPSFWFFLIIMWTEILEHVLIASSVPWSMENLSWPCLYWFPMSTYRRALSRNTMKTPIWGRKKNLFHAQVFMLFKKIFWG